MQAKFVPRGVGFPTCVVAELARAQTDCENLNSGEFSYRQKSLPRQRARQRLEAIDSGYLISMRVAPEARRQGIAARLIDAVVDWARGEGLKRLVLDVAENNLPALALYTRKGFVPNGNRGCLEPPREHIREIQLEFRL